MGRLAGLVAVVGVALASIGGYGAGGQDTAALEAQVAALEARLAEGALPPPLELPVDLRGLNPIMLGVIIEQATLREPEHVLDLTCSSDGGYGLACIRFAYRPDAPAPDWLADRFGSSPSPTPVAVVRRTDGAAPSDATRSATAGGRRGARSGGLFEATERTLTATAASR